MHLCRRVFGGLPQRCRPCRRHPTRESRRRARSGQICVDAVGVAMKPYRRPISPLWWTKKTSYTLFVLRELTSVFIWVFLLTYLVQLSHLARGTDDYLAFRDHRASFV